MENLEQLFINSWIKKIEEKITSSETLGRAVFEMGKDFESYQLDSIKNTVIPYIQSTYPKLSAKIVYFGSSSSCDCYSSPCCHSKGRKFIVQLL